MHDDPKVVPLPCILERMEDTFIPGRRWTTRDDRGARVPLQNPEWCKFPEPETERHERLLKRMGGDEFVGFLVAVPIYAAIAVPIVLIVNSFSSLSSFVSQLPSLAQTAVLLLPAFLVAHRCMKSPDEAAVTREFIAVRMCPSCTYPLEDVPVAADGATVCPERGAAWRRTRGTGYAT